MTRPVFRLSVDINKSFNKQLELVKSWPERLKKVEPMLAYKAAEYLQNFVKERIPKGSAFRGYRSGLEIVRVKGTRPGEYAYTVHINPKNKFVRTVKVQKTLLYVEPSRRLVKPSAKVLILQKYNPWTYETLPFTPDPKEGSIRTQRASIQDVQRVAVLKNRQRAKWRAELQKVGVRENKKDRRIKLPKSLTSLPEVALDAVKLEFGLGGQRPKPSWRLALSRLARREMKNFMKDKRLFVFPLTKPSFNLWKQNPKSSIKTITISQARKYKNFQKKVAHRP